MIRRTSSCAESLHLLNQERNQSARVLYSCLCLLIEICLVGRASALNHAQELILAALCSFDVYLCRQVAACVNLLIHAQRSILRVAQVLFCICLVYAFRQSLLVAEAGPYLLSLLSVDDGSTCVLAERQLALACHFGVAQESQSHILVVVACFGVVKYLGHLLVVRAAQQEVNVAEGSVCEHGQCFGAYLQYRLAFKLA